MPGWDTDLEAFVDYGRTITYLDSSSYVQGSGAANADVVPGTPVTVTVRLNNPKAIALNYTLSANSSFITGTLTAPVSTTGAADGITTVSFTFTPTAAAEHGDIEFLLGLSSPAINRTFAPAIFKVRCDSPPGPVTNLTAGITWDRKPCVAFMLPENDADADIAAVEITYKNTSNGTSKTVTEAVSRTGTGLTAPTLPAPLGTNDGMYVRYYSPSDASPGNPYEFTVTPIDASRKKSGTSTTASIAVDKLFLGYDPNGGTGAVAAVYGYETTTTATIDDGSSLSRPDYAFRGWKDDTGASYSPGVSYTFGSTSLMLHAQWKSATAINNASELADIKNDLGGTYVLTQDIDLTGVPWTPIGAYDANDPTKAFTGTLNGNGKTIKNLTTSTSAGDAGLFGAVGKGAVITGVRLMNISVQGGTAGDGVGGLVGENYGGTITRCSVSGYIEGHQGVGGLVGNNRIDGTTSPPSWRSVISECYSTATVKGTAQYPGGLVGWNWGTISNSYARCYIVNGGGGGLVDTNLATGIIENCYAVSSGSLLGGFARQNPGSCDKNYYDSTVSGLSDSIGAAGKTTEAAKTQGTYSGWNFSSVWAIDTKNSGYPYLKNVEPTGVTISSNMTAANFAALLNSDLAGDFSLESNVTISGITSIGSSDKPFRGTLNGNENTITGLSGTAGSYAGLFAYIGKGGIVKNLKLAGASIDGGSSSHIGVLAGENQGTIYRCSSSGTIAGGTSIGGLVGSNYGIAEECWSNVTVTANLYSGGLVGENGANGAGGATGLIKNCYARGVVTVKDGGGLVGANNTQGTIEKSYAAGPVFPNVPAVNLQELVGNIGGPVNNSHFDLSKIENSYHASSVITSGYYGAPESTTAMKTQATFTADNWDFGSVWTITAGKNGGYPCLRYNEAASDISVSTQSGLNAIRSKLDGDYVLSGDITLSGNWTPIGTSGNPFTGTFDGQGHTIRGLTINATSGSQALFAQTSPTACVMNVGLKDVSIYSNSGECVSAIVAVNKGTIYRCWASGTIKGEFRIAGIAGKNELAGKIEECYSIANVETTYSLDAANSIYWNIGSLVAGNYGDVKNCYSRGTVTGHKLQGIGSFMGYNEDTGTTSNSYATGLVSYEASNEGPGGFAGKKDSAGSSTITKCFYDMDTTKMNDDTGKGSPKQTTDMTSLSTFSTWDIVSGPNTNKVWGIGTYNNGYPYLQYFGANTVTP